MTTEPTATTSPGSARGSTLHCLTAAQLARDAQMRRDGFATRAIADRLGLSTSRVLKIWPAARGGNK